MGDFTAMNTHHRRSADPESPHILTYKAPPTMMSDVFGNSSSGDDDGND